MVTVRVEPSGAEVERHLRPDAELGRACQLRVGGPGLVVRKRGVRPIAEDGGT